MMNNGWIALPRAMVNHWLWRQPRKLKMWLDLVMMAQYDETVTVCGDVVHTIHRGEFATSTRQLAGKLECSRQTLFTFLDLLVRCGMIRRITVDKKFTVITIVDFDLYSPQLNKSDKSSRLSKGSQEEATKDSGNVKSTRKSTSKSESKIDAESIGDSTRKVDISVAKIENSNHTLDHKSDHRLDHIKENNNIINISSSSARVREENKKFYDEIRKSDEFWVNASLGLGMEVPKLKELAETCFGEFLTKGKLKDSRQEVESLLFNWLRSKIELGNKGARQKTQTSKLKTNNFTNHDSNKIFSSDIDSRRGTDAPVVKPSRYSQRRFMPELSDG